MDNVFLKTERTEMKFPLDFISAGDIVSAINDEETIKYMDSVQNISYDVEDAKRFMSFLEYTRNSKKYLQLGVFDISKKRFIGMCTLESINEESKTCDLGYWLDKTFTGKGYLTECSLELIKFAKNTLNMKKINAFVITEHLQSIALLERLGFEKQEYLKDNTENKGVLVDRFRYELDIR